MATLTQFLPYVLPHVPGCPDAVAEIAVRNACIDFCHTTLLVQTLTTQDIVVGQQDYNLTVPANSVLSRVLKVFYGDIELAANTVESVNSGLIVRGDVGGGVQRSDSPVIYFQKTPTLASISVYPLPATAMTLGLAVRAAFAPNRTATTVDDSLFQYWAEEIASGALHRLMATPGQQFSDNTMAAYHKSRFDIGCRSASIQSRTGLISAASRIDGRRFA